jgi:hypothetical protein
VNNLKNIILGHNSFFGINHFDNEIGRKKLITEFNNLEKISRIINFSFENNLRNFMISTVDETKSLIPKINESKKIKDELGLFILLPYINKYVRKTNELGILGVMKDVLSQQNIMDKVKISFDLMKFLSNIDYKEIIPTLIKFEMSSFKKSLVKSVILHDSLTDILVSLGRFDIILFYYEYVRKNYSCTPGFATKNLSSFLNLLKNKNIDDIYILTHVNKIGYEMNPNQTIVEEEIKKTKMNVICMSILASGYLNPAEALNYIKSLNINSNLSTVIGCSTKKHILEYINYAS